MKPYTSQCRSKLRIHVLYSLIVICTGTNSSLNCEKGSKGAARVTGLTVYTWQVIIWIRDFYQRIIGDKNLYIAVGVTLVHLIPHCKFYKPTILIMMHSQVVHSLQNDKILDQSKLKAFADDKLKVIQMAKFVLGKIENTVEKKKMLVTSIFFSSHNVFKRLFL